MSTLKATKKTAGVVGMAGDWRDVTIHWRSGDTVVELRERSVPAHQELIGLTFQVCGEIPSRAWH